MKAILVIDDQAIIRDPIAAGLKLAGYRPRCAEGGQEALRWLKTEYPDLILLDLTMPSMDGLTFLRKLRSDASVAHIPVILLTDRSDKQSILEAAGLGAKEYMLKSRFSMRELLGRIQKHLGPPQISKTTPAEASAVPKPLNSALPPDEGLPRLLTRDKCRLRAEKAMQGKTLSGVVGQVLALASNPRGDSADLAELISKDAILSARVLKAANSAAYRAGRSFVATIPEAVWKIGASTIKSIAAATGIFDVMQAPDGFNPFACWRHSFAVAQLCQGLVEPVRPQDANIAYLVGLCHDLGEILFHTTFASEYQQVLEVEQHSSKPREHLERIMLGMTHAELVAAILKQMGLPDSICDPILDFHGLKATKSTAATASMSAVLRMANYYANGCLLSSSSKSLVAPISKAQCHSAIGQGEPPAPDPENLRSEISALTSMLARLSPAEEQKLTAPMYPRSNVRLWLVRDPTLSTFDPLAVALQLIADVQIHDRLPNPEESAQVAQVFVLRANHPSPGVEPATSDRAVALAYPLALEALAVVVQNVQQTVRANQPSALAA